jgi:hypothetical protein
MLRGSVSEVEVVVASQELASSPALVVGSLGGRETYIPGCMTRSFFGSIKPFRSCCRLNSEPKFSLLFFSASEWSNSLSSSPRSTVKDAYR